jgi:hypothetical protein
MTTHVDLKEVPQLMRVHRKASPSRRPRLLAVLAGVITGFAVTGVSAVSAAAATTPPPVTPAVSASASSCSTTASLSQPFLSWNDANYYDLVSGGDFEGSLTGWTLTGGAGVTSGSEPYAATGKLGSKSIALPAGASVQSPYFCVNADEPSFRFFARNDSLLANLTVEVVYENESGISTVLPVGLVALTGSWAPSTAMPTNGALAAAVNGGTAEVALRFVAFGGASQIDDVFVDPHCK